MIKSIGKNEFKLDLKDRKILYELDWNCRQTCSQIGKKVALSSEVVNYRIRKMEEEGVITQYQVALDLSKLGIIQFKILLSFQHMDSKKLDEILKNLKENKSVKWIVSCNGSWDLLISLEAESIQEIDSLKNEIMSLFENYINKKAVSIFSSGFVYNRDYLTGKKTYNRTRVIVSGDKKEKLDKIDLEILKKLAENARKPIVDLAGELKTSARVVNYRIRQLEKERIITGFRVAINYDKLGIRFYKTFFYLDSPKKERLEKLGDYLASNKNVIHNLKVVGSWDIEPEFEVYSETEFSFIIEDLKDKFSDIIKSIDIVTISKEHKFVYL
ncbi:MAG: Lrp/AsnC family transcriptional regulator [Nanoarchaeota archaeon]|nr:Lrp/AsnC family transcriptional regulator [Nanoarchaeota archaeon]MBU4086647.1 Lrp/AsnC family transcriptional regulator [Nanoarchaeota archaeon]